MLSYEVIFLEACLLKCHEPWMNSGPVHSIRTTWWLFMAGKIVLNEDDTNHHLLCFYCVLLGNRSRLQYGHQLVSVIYTRWRNGIGIHGASACAICAMTAQVVFFVWHNKKVIKNAGICTDKMGRKGLMMSGWTTTFAVIFDWSLKGHQISWKNYAYL